MKINLGVTTKAMELLRQSDQRTESDMFLSVAFSGEVKDGWAPMVLGWHNKECVSRYVVEIGQVKVAVLITDEMLDFFNSLVLDLHINKATLAIRESVQNDVDRCRNILVSMVETKLLH